MLLHGLFQIDRLVSKRCFLDVELHGELEKYCVVNRCLVAAMPSSSFRATFNSSLRQLSDAAFFIRSGEKLPDSKILQRTLSA